MKKLEYFKEIMLTVVKWQLALKQSPMDFYKWISYNKNIISDSPWFKTNFQKLHTVEMWLYEYSVADFYFQKIFIPPNRVPLGISDEIISPYKTKT